MESSLNNSIPFDHDGATKDKREMQELKFFFFVFFSAAIEEMEDLFELMIFRPCCLL